jgi:hypothetical protein
MAKHIAPPATAEQIRRTLGVSREDMEIVERLLQEPWDPRGNPIEQASMPVDPCVDPLPIGRHSKKRE